MRPSSPKAARGCSSRARTLGRRSQRERDGQVGAGLVHPHASGHGYEHVAAAQRGAAVTSQHRQHEGQAVAVHPVGHPPRRHQLARRYQRLHLHQQRARALHRTQHHRAGSAGGLAHEARAGVLDLHQALLLHLEHSHLVGRAEAVLERPQRPVGALALALEGEHAVHEVLEHARPASEPSLVTCPTSTTATARSLAMRISRPATSRTWPTEPGLPDIAGSYSTCTESTTQTSGRSASIVASTASRSVSATMGTLSAAGPRRCARSFTCAADSSPDT